MDFNSFKARVKVLDSTSMRGIVGGSGTCAFRTHWGFVFAGVSKAEAMSYSRGGGNWCCDSCHKASWLQSESKSDLVLSRPNDLVITP